ncbi:MAG: hypothetical protein GXY86_10830 [Firmicutes bacterium]|nr:hypothetical protein [Bacillota bacterium]
MNRVLRSLVTGSLVGAAVGLVMLTGRRRGMMNTASTNNARGAVRMVRDNTMRWTSALKNGTEAFSRRMARRMQ